MINERFVLIGAAFILLGDFSYLIAAIQGKIRPNGVTWLLWSLAPLIAFFAELKQGVGLASIATASFGIFPFFIFLTAVFNKKSRWKIQKFDILCGALSIAGLVIWYITQIGNLAILFSILSDGFAALPTIIKSIYHPKTESPYAYLGSAIGSGITLLSLRNLDFASSGFPIYIFFCCVLLFALIKFNIGKLIHK